MLLNACCFITSFFQHFIPPVFLTPATLINPPFHFYKSDRSLLSSSGFSLLSLTPSVSSSSRLLLSLRVTLCLPGRSVRSAKVGQLEWQQIGTDQENNRVNWGWAFGRAQCSCWQSVLIVDKRGATDKALHRLIATERKSKKDGLSVFFFLSCGSLLNSGWKHTKNRWNTKPNFNLGCGQGQCEFEYSLRLLFFWSL